MKVNQIYSTINSIKNDICKGAVDIIDHSTFVNFGETVISSESNKDAFYKALVDRIGRTVFAIRDYKAANRNVLVDEFTFGSILQKISFKLQDAESNPHWNDEPENPYTWKAKEGVIQKLFAQDMPTFSYKDVLLDNQLESAFVNAQAMAGFFSAIATRMYNALEVSIEGLNDNAICALAGRVYKNATTDSINKTRVRNLLKEYNTAFNANLTPTEALSNESFLQYACVEMGTVIPFLGKLTSMYNDGTVERYTDSENLVVEVNTEFEKKFDVYLKSNTYHDSLVSLPNYASVPYWFSPTMPMAIHTNDGTENIEIENVIAIFRDKDAVASTLERQSYRTMYDSINGRTYVKLSADRRYIADTSENCIIFYLATE